MAAPGAAVEKRGRSDALAVAVAAAQAADDKLARDIVVLDVSAVLAIVDLFVIAHGGTDRQVRAIVEQIEEVVAERCGTKPLRVEGLDNYTWVLMDYGAVVVHVFAEETRRYYELERLWGDMARIDWQEQPPLSAG